MRVECERCDVRVGGATCDLRNERQREKGEERKEKREVRTERGEEKRRNVRLGFECIHCVSCYLVKDRKRAEVAERHADT